MSVTMAPLSRRAVKAAWPGVSRKVMSSPDDVFTAEKKQIYAIYTRAIPSLKDFLQKSVVGVYKQKFNILIPSPLSKNILPPKHMLKILQGK